MTELHTTPELPPETIMFEILPKLPAKTLMSFKSVYKEWESFLSTPMFARMHLRHVTNDESRIHHKLLVFDSLSPTFHTLDCETSSSGSTTIRSFPFEVDPNDIPIILGSLDGLVCVALDITLELVFWNPLTGAYKKSSNPRGFSYTDAVGFFIDSCNDYKLLHLVPNGASKGVYIYSLRSDSWREIQYLENPNRMSKYLWSRATFNGENLYFTVRGKRFGSQSYVIAFDVNSEKFRKIGFPPVPRNAITYCGSFVLLEGCIHLRVAYSKKTDVFEQPAEIELWRRMDGDRWMKVAAFSDTRCNPKRHRPICVTRNGKPFAIFEYHNEVHIIDMMDFATGSLCQFHERERVYTHTLR